ncbi:hypothetical protein H074_27673 [Amycolatopsis decaplanina DSM 44594]|uniref:Uncharacterized protein n=1 Tax=Amycolatopsis decaplanina DSM 44594 TaxID=1284240 RepID=M2XZ43_9PSEU|nr:hypothetical protein H074_27673 [Amycolatopsis decaplanina DSM 44594]
MPRWAKWSAHTVALVNIPSGVWRLGLAAGIPFGLAQSEMDAMKTPGWGSLYLVFLTVFSEAVALPALGLIQPWGETWPRWLPFVGGEPVSARKVVIVSSLGALATTIYAGLFVCTTFNADMAGEPWADLLISVLYAPLLLWGPLLAVVTWHYHRRRSQAS